MIRMGKGNMQLIKIEIADVKLHECTLVAVYEEKSERAILQHTIEIPLGLQNEPIIGPAVTLDEAKIQNYVDIGFGTFAASRVDTKIMSREMTPKEIEKELGYKVKIVEQEKDIKSCCYTCKHNPGGEKCLT